MHGKQSDEEDQGLLAFYITNQHSHWMLVKKFGHKTILTGENVHVNEKTAAPVCLPTEVTE